MRINRSIRRLACGAIVVLGLSLIAAAAGKPGKAMSAYARDIAANSSNEFVIGAAGNVAFFLGNPRTTRISTAVASLSITSKGQFLLSAKLSAFARDNRRYLEDDNRFNWTSQDTYGLGEKGSTGFYIGTQEAF